MLNTPLVAKHTFEEGEQSHLLFSDAGDRLNKRFQLAKPFADLMGRVYLDSRIRKKIHRLKKDQPSLTIGETHCHSNFSDGVHSVQSILKRAAWLGLDYVVITDHLIPGKVKLESILACFEAQDQCVSELDEKNKPVQVYPAFEISALEGHLVIILDPKYFSREKILDISLQFSDFDGEFFSMLDVIPRIHPFGGISIVAHPEKNLTYPIGASIKWVKDNPIGLVDGVEDISTAHGYQKDYSRELGLASIGSSDDHFNLLVGTAVTAYDGSLHSDLISAVKAKQTEAIIVENSLQPLLAAARQVMSIGSNKR